MPPSSVEFFRAFWVGVCLSVAQVNGLFQGSLGVMLLVVLDTILEKMCLEHKPLMHKSQAVLPGRQQYSAMYTGCDCSAGRACRDIGLCWYSGGICMRRMAGF